MHSKGQQKGREYSNVLTRGKNQNNALTKGSQTHLENRYAVLSEEDLSDAADDVENCWEIVQNDNNKKRRKLTVDRNKKEENSKKTKQIVNTRDKYTVPMVIRAVDSSTQTDNIPDKIIIPTKYRHKLTNIETNIGGNGNDEEVLEILQNLSRNFTDIENLDAIIALICKLVQIVSNKEVNIDFIQNVLSKK